MNERKLCKRSVIYVIYVIYVNCENHKKKNFKDVLYPFSQMFNIYTR